MRRLLFVSLAAFTGAFAAILFICLPLGARAGGGGIAGENGDTNGDGAIDISDVVYTLNHLFRSGPAPVACADSPDLVKTVAELQTALARASTELDQARTSLAESVAEVERLKRLPRVLTTDVTECYDDMSIPVSCNDPNWPGQDGNYRLGCGLDGRFINSMDGTIADNCTGLIWLEQTAEPPDGICCKWEVTWHGALRFCEDLQFAGHDDWRLPNIRELQTIHDFRADGSSNSMSHRLYSIFKVTPPGGEQPFAYWSSTPKEADVDVPWTFLVQPGGPVISRAIIPLCSVIAVRGP